MTIQKSNTNGNNTLANISALEKVLIYGDLSPLSPQERIEYYHRVCESLGLNPLTKPFEYIIFQGQLRLYARRDCTDQLRKIHNISIRILSRKIEDGIYTVEAEARTPEGRTDVSTGSVCIEGLKGDAKANAFMKAETKAKRRVTLSICGLGMLDETELETIPGVVNVEAVNVVKVNETQAEKKTEAPALSAANDADDEKESCTREQLREMAKLFEELGWENEKRRKAVAEVIGREVGAASNMTRQEAEAVIEQLRLLIQEMEEEEAYHDDCSVAAKEAVSR